MAAGLRTDVHLSVVSPLARAKGSRSNSAWRRANAPYFTPFSRTVNGDQPKARQVVAGRRAHSRSRRPKWSTFVEQRWVDSGNRLRGFHEIGVEPMRARFTYPSAKAFWEANSRASAPSVATRRRVPSEAWPEIEVRILDTLMRSFPDRVDFERAAWVEVGRTQVG